MFSPGRRNVLSSYSINYALGAYLARNFGGAELFQNIVQNSESGIEAINTALANNGYGDEDFGSILRKWGVAVLLSDDDPAADPEVPETYRYNTGDFVDTTIGGYTYGLGSINAYNYRFRLRSGPRVYNRLPPHDLRAGTYKTSNMFYKLGSRLTGTVTKRITLRSGDKLTVLVK